MSDTTVNGVLRLHVDMEQPTLLHSSDDHRIFRLGITDESAFRSNVDLICDGSEAILLEPGSKPFFPQIRQQVAQILPPQQRSIIGANDVPAALAYLRNMRCGTDIIDAALED